MKLYILAWIIAAWTAIRWTDPNASFYSLSSVTYESLDYPGGMSPYFIKPGPNSGAFYWFGAINNSVDVYTFIRKVNSSNNEIWSKTYATAPINKTFIIDSVETYAYFIDSINSTQLTFLEVQWSTGLLNRVISSSGKY